MVTQYNFWRSKNKKVARLIVWFTVCNFGHFWRENSNIYEISDKFEFSRQKPCLCYFRHFRRENWNDPKRKKSTKSTKKKNLARKFKHRILCPNCYIIKDFYEHFIDFVWFNLFPLWPHTKNCNKAVRSTTSNPIFANKPLRHLKTFNFFGT